MTFFCLERPRSSFVALLLLLLLRAVCGVRVEEAPASLASDDEASPDNPPLLAEGEAQMYEANSPSALALQSKHAFKAGAPECICEDFWIFRKYRGCGKGVHGCPNKACDGANTPWCLVKNEGCATEEAQAGWTFCGPEAAGSDKMPRPQITDEVSPILQLLPYSAPGEGSSEQPSTASADAGDVVAAATATSSSVATPPRSSPPAQFVGRSEQPAPSPPVVAPMLPPAVPPQEWAPTAPSSRTVPSPPAPEVVMPVAVAVPQAVPAVQPRVRVPQQPAPAARAPRRTHPAAVAQPAAQFERNVWGSRSPAAAPNSQPSDVASLQVPEQAVLPGQQGQPQVFSASSHTSSVS
eukprot:TRINITY_DN70206_c0_g1_i1.p1 TRINITY_DN70206_c0_g1~~TRINITY_DN70206_c0_g1_i1.p1  ORF type:complete len:352 (-),score=65.01 TRINITY_DN70206_c0_g1_i1:83-1138(-)